MQPGRWGPGFWEGSQEDRGGLWRLAFPILAPGRVACPCSPPTVTDIKASRGFISLVRYCFSVQKYGLYQNPKHLAWLSWIFCHL